MVAAGCGGGASGTATASGGGGGGGGGGYNIGAALSLTGPYASFATGYRNGLSAYFKQVNSQGGINGHQVNFQALDDGGVTTTTLANTRQLVGSDHSSLVFYIVSDNLQASMPYLKSTNTAVVSQAVDSQLIHPVNPYFFAGGIIEPDEATPMLNFGASKVANVAQPKAAMIATTSVALQELDNNLQSGAKAKGMQVVGNQMVQSSQTTLQSEATQFASKHPDIVFSGLVASQETSFVQTLRQQGFNGPIIQYDGGFSYPLMTQLADPNLYFLTAFSFGQNPGPQVQTMRQAATAQGNQASDYFFGNGYAQAYVVGQGLKACGYPCNGTKLAKALSTLSNLNTGGLTFGSWVYSPKSHPGTTSVAFFNWDPATKQAVQAATTPMPST